MNDATKQILLNQVMLLQLVSTLLEQPKEVVQAVIDRVEETKRFVENA